MQEVDSELPPQETPSENALSLAARSRLEAQRAKAEIEFRAAFLKLVANAASSEAPGGPETLTRLQELMVGYIHHVFFAFAEEALNSEWRAEIMREEAEEFLESMMDEAFLSKHPFASRSAWRLHFQRFRQFTSIRIYSSPGWLEFQQGLAEIAELDASAEQESTTDQLYSIERNDPVTEPSNPTQGSAPQLRTGTPLCQTVQSTEITGGRSEPRPDLDNQGIVAGVWRHGGIPSGPDGRSFQQDPVEGGDDPTQSADFDHGAACEKPVSEERYLDRRVNAERRFREAVLQSFLRPDLPTRLELLGHARTLAESLFDAEAEKYFADVTMDSGYQNRLWMLKQGIPALIFGGPDEQVPLGSIFHRAIEHGITTRLDHARREDPPEQETTLLKEYGGIKGHFFLSPYVGDRSRYWTQKAVARQTSGEQKIDEVSPSPIEPRGTCNVELSDQELMRHGIVAEVERLLSDVSVLPPSEPGYEHLPYRRAIAHSDAISKVVHDAADWLERHGGQSGVLDGRIWLSLVLTGDRRSHAKLNEWPIENLIRDLAFIRELLRARTPEFPAPPTGLAGSEQIQDQPNSRCSSKSPNLPRRAAPTPVPDPEVAKRRAIIQRNPRMKASDLCGRFDVGELKLPPNWETEFGVRDWVSAYRKPRLRSRIDTMISKDRVALELTSSTYLLTRRFGNS